MEGLRVICQPLDGVSRGGVEGERGRRVTRVVDEVDGWRDRW